ncbi:uncharacterized protein LOC130560525 isoform X2 [Triplophysa rosa]|uniref:uncharacterized protein LOC130560525 isoform X2 n=1 Tax=Triplophysa rosa TaxID=992332 RepID=UPI002546394C|nr:uncharacterized protein LOC130560525 isoform X2 [Triplophysa rosa]
MVDPLEVFAFPTAGYDRDMHSTLWLRGWRCLYQSSPNIYEAVDNEHSWYVHQNATAPWRSPRTRWEIPSREWNTSASLSGYALYDEPWRSRTITPSRCLLLSRTRSVPEALDCLHSPTLHSRFSSVTITARSLSPNRDRMAYSSSRISHVNMSSKPPSFIAHSENKTLHARPSVTMVSPRRKAIAVTVTESTEQHSTSVNIQSFQDPTEKDSVSKTEQTDSSSSSKTSARLFRSCAHLEVMPSRLSSSTLYLDKSLMIPLGQPQKYNGTLHRSTLSLSLRRSNQTSDKLGVIFQPKKSYSEWDISSIGVDGKEKPSQPLMDTPTLTSSAFGNITSSASNTQYSTLTSLPFRTRCHSSSAAFRLNGKANDVLGPPQSNLRARQAFSQRSEPVLNKMVDSTGICKSISSAVSVKHIGHKCTATDPDFSSNTLRKQIRVPRARVSPPGEVSHTAEKVRRVAVWSASPHLFNCTCVSRPDQHDTKLQSLSLREALELFRPDFISRSQNRVRRLEQRARQRQHLQMAESLKGVEPANPRRNCTKSHPLSGKVLYFH